MRRKGMILAGICVLGLCAGCGQKKSTTLEQEIVVISDETEHSDEAGTDQIEAMTKKGLTPCRKMRRTHQRRRNRRMCRHRRNRHR